MSVMGPGCFQIRKRNGNRIRGKRMQNRLGVLPHQAQQKGEPNMGKEMGHAMRFYPRMKRRWEWTWMGTTCIA